MLDCSTFKQLDGFTDVWALCCNCGEAISLSSRYIVEED